MPITADLLVELCKYQERPKRVRVVKNAVPDDARVVRAGHDNDGGLLVVIESQTFEPSVEGERLPRLEPTYFEAIYDEDTP